MAWFLNYIIIFCISLKHHRSTSMDSNTIGGEGYQESSTAEGSMGNFQRRQVENKTRSITDYQLVRIIGTGTFGKVYLAILDGKSFALKILHKKKIIDLKQIEHIKSEKNILACVENPFIVNLIETFQDKLNLYLVFDFI